MKLILYALVATLLSSARAQDPAAAPPKITAEQRAKWWKAVADSLAANEGARKALDKVNEARADLMRTCAGALAADAEGEPVCTPVKPAVK